MPNPELTDKDSYFKSIQEFACVLGEVGKERLPLKSPYCLNIMQISDAD
jgi:hypothetical protein